MITSGRRILRHEVPVDGREHVISLTHSPVTVAVADAWPDLVEFWAEYAEDIPPVERAFRVFGTGQPLPGGARWAGTCPRRHGLVWHLYEMGGDAA